MLHNRLLSIMVLGITLLLQYEQTQTGSAVHENNKVSMFKNIEKKKLMIACLVAVGVVTGGTVVGYTIYGRYHAWESSKKQSFIKIFDAFQTDTEVLIKNKEACIGESTQQEISYNETSDAVIALPYQQETCNDIPASSAAQPPMDNTEYLSKLTLILHGSPPMKSNQVEI